PFELVIVGDGPLARPLRGALGEALEVSFRGWLTPCEVAAELTASDVYLSLSDTESFSLTAQEALASGVAVVAPDVIGFRRLRGKGVGLLFPGGWLRPAGMAKLAGALRESRPRMVAWANRAEKEAAGLSWDQALTSLGAALEHETRL